MSFFKKMRKSRDDKAVDKASVEALPEKVYITIFGYLDYTDLLSASLVCKTWNHYVKVFNGSTTSTQPKIQGTKNTRVTISIDKPKVQRRDNRSVQLPVTTIPLSSSPLTGEPSPVLDQVSTAPAARTTSAPNFSNSAASSSNGTAAPTNTSPNISSPSPPARKGMWRRMFSFRQSGSEDPKPEETTSTPEEAPLKREESKNITGPFSTSPQENIKILKNSIRTFVKNLLKKKFTPDQQRESVNSFISELESTISSLWKQSNLFDVVNIQDELRTFFFTELCKTIFDDPEDKAQDEWLSKRIDQLSWITPAHLDIEPSQWNTELWEAAKTELLLLNTFVTPKEKLVCILNTCKIIIYLLQNVGSQAGADDFLPHFIYVVIKANVPQLHTNVKFISRFTDTELMFGENYCFFTHLVSATSFVTMMDHTCVNMDLSEWNRHMGIEEEKTEGNNAVSAASKKALKILGVGVDTPSNSKSNNKREGRSSGTSSQIEEPSPPSSASHSRSSSRSSLRSEGDRLSSTFISTRKSSFKIDKITQRFPFFAHTVEQLKMSDIADLLSQYKEFAMQLVATDYSVEKKPKMVILKVKQKEDEYFRLIGLSKMKIRSLHKCIRKRFNKTNDVGIEQLLLIPDTIIETNEDVMLLQEYSQLLVVWKEPPSPTASIDNPEANGIFQSSMEVQPPSSTPRSTSSSSSPRDNSVVFT